MKGFFAYVFGLAVGFAVVVVAVAVIMGAVVDVPSSDVPSDQERAMAFDANSR